MSLASIIEQMHAQAQKKLSAKVPAWAGKGLCVPQTLNLEQCSSAATALYKARLAWELMYRGDAAENCAPCGRIADLTGGLGVDSWAFSQYFSRVLHNERDRDLSSAVQDNFAILGVVNAEFSSLDADDPRMLDVLHAFEPDVIFLDPARRNATGKKVFLLEDCSPNVLDLLPALLEVCPHLVIKLSPMADITMLQKKLGGVLQQVHIVESGGECKELLCILGRNKAEQGESPEQKASPEQEASPEQKASPEPVISVISVHMDCEVKLVAGTPFCFTPDCEKEAAAIYASPEDLVPGALLFEPGAALMKAGAFKLTAARSGMSQLSADCHLYIQGKEVPVPNTNDSAPNPKASAQCICTGLTSSAESMPGKYYIIEEAVDFSGKGVRAVGKKYPMAEVSARGIMMKSEELRARLGVRSGGDIHIFGVAGPEKRKYLIVCRQTQA